MTKFIALLRAVNLGGATQVAMADLREMLEGMGYDEVRSLLQSGNLVFSAETASPLTTERRLETEALRKFRRPIEFFARTAPEWKAIVERNPFPAEARSDPGHLLLTCLKDAPSADAWEDLRAGIRGPERVTGLGRQAYMVYPNGVGRSPVTALFIEKKLGTRGTSRNWNTVVKIDALASEPSS